VIAAALAESKAMRAKQQAAAPPPDKQLEARTPASKPARLLSITEQLQAKLKHEKELKLRRIRRVGIASALIGAEASSLKATLSDDFDPADSGPAESSFTARPGAPGPTASASSPRPLRKWVKRTVISAKRGGSGAIHGEQAPAGRSAAVVETEEEEEEKAEEEEEEVDLESITEVDARERERAKERDATVQALKQKQLRAARMSTVAATARPAVATALESRAVQKPSKAVSVTPQNSAATPADPAAAANKLQTKAGGPPAQKPGPAGVLPDRALPQAGAGDDACDPVSNPARRLLTTLEPPADGDDSLGPSAPDRPTKNPPFFSGPSKPAASDSPMAGTRGRRVSHNAGSAVPAPPPAPSSPGPDAMRIASADPAQPPNRGGQARSAASGERSPRPQDGSFTRSGGSSALVTPDLPEVIAGGLCEARRGLGVRSERDKASSGNEDARLTASATPSAGQSCQRPASPPARLADEGDLNKTRGPPAAPVPGVQPPYPAIVASNTIAATRTSNNLPGSEVLPLPAAGVKMQPPSAFHALIATTAAVATTSAPSAPHAHVTERHRALSAGRSSATRFPKRTGTSATGLSPTEPAAGGVSAVVDTGGTQSFELSAAAAESGSRPARKASGGLADSRTGRQKPRPVRLADGSVLGGSRAITAGISKKSLLFISFN